MFYFNLAIFTYHIFGTSGIPLPNLWFFLTIGGKKERLAAESEARAQTYGTAAAAEHLKILLAWINRSIMRPPQPLPTPEAGTTSRACSRLLKLQLHSSAPHAPRIISHNHLVRRRRRRAFLCTAAAAETSGAPLRSSVYMCMCAFAEHFRCFLPQPGLLPHSIIFA